jgi:hypothetical protein
VHAMRGGERARDRSGARWRSASVIPGGGSRRPNRVRVVATRSEGARAHIQRSGVGFRASTTTGTERGWRGPRRLAGASATVCARDKK